MQASMLNTGHDASFFIYYRKDIGEETTERSFLFGLAYWLVAPAFHLCPVEINVSYEDRCKPSGSLPHVAWTTNSAYAFSDSREQREQRYRNSLAALVDSFQAAPQLWKSLNCW